MLLPAHEGRVVRDRDRRLGPERRVVLEDQDPRRDDIDRLEDPQVVAVEVDREDADVALDPRAPDQAVDVVAVDERGHRLDLLAPPGRVAREPALVRVRAVEHEAAPVVVDQQEARVGLRVVLDAELDEHVVLDRDLGDEVLDDPVLAELGEDLELGVGERRVRRQRPHPRRLGAADLQPQALELERQRSERLEHPQRPPQILNPVDHAHDLRTRSNSSMKSSTPPT